MGNLEGLGYRGAAVVITGGASGMGEAIARILGELGAKVHIADIQEPKVPCESFQWCDLSDARSVREATSALRALGPFDFLFPCAGVAPHDVGALKCLMINYAGTRQFTEEMLPALRDGGSIGLISSVAARYWQHHLAEHLEVMAASDPAELRHWFEARPDRLRDGYSTSKELMIVWIQQAAVKLAQERRIRINCIAPCPTSTAFMEAAAVKLGSAFMDSYPYPLLDRMANAEEQAWSLLLLASPLNASVTGSVLYTDQGYAGGLVTGVLAPAGSGQAQTK